MLENNVTWIFSDERKTLMTNEYAAMYIFDNLVKEAKEN